MASLGIWRVKTDDKGAPFSPAAKCLWIVDLAGLGDQAERPEKATRDVVTNFHAAEDHELLDPGPDSVGSDSGVRYLFAFMCSGSELYFGNLTSSST